MSNLLDIDSEFFAADFWQAVVDTAHEAGLDPTKFGAEHQEIVGRIAAFLKTSFAEPSKETELESTGQWGRFWWNRPLPEPEETVISPIVICGVPGTGKTTFLYLLDRVLRQYVGLPDPIAPVMINIHEKRYSVPKRMFCGVPVSLLSVRKWSELHRFYAWDTEEHRFDRPRLSEFLQETIGPMRIIFADEVEPSGYSPTLPDMTEQNILVIGTSNQYDFPQLDLEKNSPILYYFEGPDLRTGDPADAVVSKAEKAWDLFDTLATGPLYEEEQMVYQMQVEQDRVSVLVNFRSAVQNPMYETDWFVFLSKTWDSLTDGKPLNSESKFTLLMESFSLRELRTDYNAVIRFVWLFDAIEQLGIGVLVRNHDQPAEISREAFNHMKVTIHTARGVTQDVKDRALVGIDRVVSRIGQAGVRARAIYEMD
ncbi:MAG: hypothetical protein AAF902_11965 [Chloroflexota bacterium]